MTRRQRTRQVPVALPTLESISSTWLRSIRLSGFTIATLTVLVLTVIVLAPSLKILIEQRQQVASLSAQLSQQQREVNELKKERARWDDPEYIQSLARTRLDYVFPGEFTYLVVDDGKSVTTSDGLPISTAIQTTNVDWVNTMLTSVLKSGLEKSEPGK
jgi:cell division protein FtsB